MIVSWLFSERKQKKNANRSTPCILVQNLGVSGKRTDSASFFWSLHQMLGRGCRGCWGPRAAFPPGERGEGLREQIAKTLPTKTGWEIVELRLVRHSGLCRIGGPGGCVLGAQHRKRTRGGGKAGEPGLWENGAGLLCMRVQGRHKDGGHVSRAAQRELPRDPPGWEGCVRVWSPPSCPGEKWGYAPSLLGSLDNVGRVRREAVT